MLGFPKGLVLGYFLFLIYINDIIDDLDCNIKLFADDTFLYVIVDEQNYIHAADMFSTDLSHIHMWSNNWVIKFNHNKSESVLFTRRNINSPQFTLGIWTTERQMLIFTVILISKVIVNGMIM